MSPYPSLERKYPVGAELSDGGVSFRVWAKSNTSVDVVIDGRRYPMTAETDGYFSTHIPGLSEGTLYRYSLNGSDETFADPASRFQPEGLDGPSMVTDPKEYQWRDSHWRGVKREDAVLYEMHIGTFTPEGTWAAARELLPRLKDIGITVIEMMPVNEFAGQYGWGYDGVLPFAPTRVYGNPNDLRAFIEEAHSLEIAVILDAVYNHFGSGDRYESFSKDYFSDHHNEWGRSINFDGPNSRPVRDFFVCNAAYWIDEFHFDGLRLDATQALNDKTEPHVIGEISMACRKAAGERTLYLLAENEPQEARLVRPIEHKGHGLDAVWNDDFHHSATVAMTGGTEAYYHDYRGQPQEFVAAAKYGYLFQGQRYDWQDMGRGTPDYDLEPSRFVHFLQNHDQIANSARGLRMSILSTPRRVRAMTALLLLGPQSPMLFQGQEFCATTPFFYFSDQSDPELAQLVSNGRIDFLQQMPSLEDPNIIAKMANPSSQDTFTRSKLNWGQFHENEHAVAMHRDLLTMRRMQPAFAQAAKHKRVDGNVIGPAAFFLRYRCDETRDDKILLVNLGNDLVMLSVPDPLFAPPEGMDWVAGWTSEAVKYGGTGQRPTDIQRRWVLPADTALVLDAVPKMAREVRTQDSLKEWQWGISHRRPYD